jgi:PleD family two-component response regulator
VITISIGVAARESGDESPRETMVRADARLYRAKRHRNAVGSGEIRPSRAQISLSEPATDT